MAARASSSLPANLERFLGTVATKDPEYGANARKAVEKLCEMGQTAGRDFDPETLAHDLEYIRIWQDEAESGHAWRPLQYGRRADEAFSPHHLKRIANRARELQNDMLKLRQTAFIFELNATKRIPEGDLLHHQTGAALNTLTELPALASSLYGRPRRNAAPPNTAPRSRMLPQTEYGLWQLSHYVKETTGRWNDSLLVDILGPLRIPHCQGVDALKMWRSHRTHRFRLV
jgi:hypothetical protein